MILIKEIKEQFDSEKEASKFFVFCLTLNFKDGYFKEVEINEKTVILRIYALNREE